MPALLALLFPLVLLALGVPGARAAPLALILALGLALLAGVPLEALASALGQALPLALEVGAILFGGLYFHLASEARGREGLAAWPLALEDPARRVLFAVFGLTPFFESVTGFGVGVVLVLPLLQRLGLPPGRAAALGLLGLVLVPWGALGPGTLVAARIGGVGLDALGLQSALYTLPVLLAAGLGALRVAGLAPGRGLPLLLLGAFGLWGLLLLANRLLGTPPAGALAGLGAALLLGGLPPRGAVQALGPYALLLGLLLLGRLLGLPSPALWLPLTGLLLAWGQGAGALAGRALSRAQGAILTTGGFLLLGALLGPLGIGRVFLELGQGLGILYAPFLPLLAGLMGGLTGSNSGANALLAGAHAAWVQGAGYPLLKALALENVAASFATLASPARVSLAESLVGQRAAREGLGLALPYLLLALLALGLIAATP